MCATKMYSAEPLFLQPCSIRKELIDLLGSEPQYREFPTKGILVCRNLFWRFLPLLMVLDCLPC